MKSLQQPSGEISSAESDANNETWRISLGLSRRDLLRMGVCAGAGLLAAPRSLLSQQAASSAMNMNMARTASHDAAMPQFHQAEPAGPLLSYVTPLSVPPVIRPQSGAVPIRMVPFRHKAHRDLPPATMWGYNGMWPGPTFEVRKGQPLSVKWSNQLPTKHFLAHRHHHPRLRRGSPRSPHRRARSRSARFCPKATATPTPGLPPMAKSARFPPPIPRIIPTRSPPLHSGITITL